MKMLDFARKKLSEHAHPVLSVLDTNTRAIALYTPHGLEADRGTELEFTPCNIRLCDTAAPGLDAVRGQRTEVTPGGSCRCIGQRKRHENGCSGQRVWCCKRTKTAEILPAVEKMLKTFVSTL